MQDLYRFRIFLDVIISAFGSSDFNSSYLGSLYSSSFRFRLFRFSRLLIQAISYVDYFHVRALSRTGSAIFRFRLFLM